MTHPRGSNGKGRKRKSGKNGWFTEDKSAGKTPGTALAPRGKPFSGEGDPRNGHGPEKGHGGRPPNEFFEWLKDLVYSPEVRRRYEAILKLSPDPELFLKALKFGEERLHGKPVQPVDFGGGNEGEVEIEFRLRRPR